MPISIIDTSTSFILGPGRSGTTLFYKLLSLHPDVGYFNNYMAKFGGIPKLAILNRGIRDRIDLKRWSWFDTAGGAYADSGRPFLRKITPTPSECEPLYSRCGVPDTPPSGSPLSSDVEDGFGQPSKWQGHRAAHSRWSRSGLPTTGAYSNCIMRFHVHASSR